MIESGADLRVHSHSPAPEESQVLSSPLDRLVGGFLFAVCLSLSASVHMGSSQSVSQSVVQISACTW